MAYWLDEAWHRWPQIDEIGTAVAGLYSRCGAYIADEETDGFIPAARARMYGTPEWIQRLVDVGLWAVEEKGYRDLRYLELNATKEKKAERAAGAARRQARYQNKAKRQSRASGASDDASLTRPPFPPPSGGKGARADLRPVPDWCGRCNKDTRLDINDDDRSVPCRRCHPDRRRSA